MSLCQSDYVKNALISQCEQRGSLEHCSSLKYARTLYKDKNGVPAFAIAPKFKYDTDAMKVVYSKASAYSTKWNNQLNLPQSETFEHDITKTTEQTFTNTVTSKISSSITVKETAGLPAIVQEQISTTITAELDASSTETKSVSTSQTWKESQTINVPKKTCVEGCMIETNGEVTLPYSFTANITSTYVDQKFDQKLAAQCCYLRPGGATHCAFLDGPGPSGWNYVFTPAQAVSLGQQNGIEQCAGFMAVDSDAAQCASRGEFKGGVGFNVSIATVKCGGKGCRVP